MCEKIDSNKAYELYRKTGDEVYIKILKRNGANIAKSYIKKNRKKGCVYFLSSEDLDYAINWGLSYALKTYNFSKAGFSTHLFTCICSRVTNVNKVRTTEEKWKDNMKLMSLNYMIFNKDGKTQESIDLLTYDKCVEAYYQEYNMEFYDMNNCIKDEKSKKIFTLLYLGYSQTDISKIINMKVATISSRVRKTIKRELTEGGFGK